MGKMKKLNTLTIAIYAGIAAVVIGLITFTISWNFWDVWGGPLPGSQFLLYPGNLTLIYVWHPLFSEEVNLLPKLGLLLLGLFTVVTCVAAFFITLIKKWLRVRSL